jgi:hypothetical protein
MDENDFARIEKLFKAQSEDFHRWLGVQGEEFQQKIALVADGHQMLSAKIDRVEACLGAVDEKLSRKIDAVAAELAAHRADTEAHHGIYRVKEGDEGFGD